ncbi:hypothetical protein ILUMI_11299 [Ignelater luminosus]|uniref:Uncharacterized protein n=1 Tax=Ignelater luminosus TaxID=2038154 RepID=A0A8K0CWB6_IGNLU|nr:hypothetical protein ILUMI_11299 [Ignelater luminosus]
MFQPGKTQKIVKEMERLKLDSLEISDNKDNLIKKETKQSIQKNPQAFQKASEKKENDDVNTKWEKMKKALMHKANDTLNAKKTREKQEWITSEILGLMEIRRKQKNKNVSKYREIEKIKQAKKKYMEALQAIRDTLNLYKRVEELTGLGK